MEGVHASEELGLVHDVHAGVDQQTAQLPARVAHLAEVRPRPSDMCLNLNNNSNIENLFYFKSL